MDEKTKTTGNLETFRLNSPFEFEYVPLLEPFTKTETAGTLSLEVLFLTEPETVTDLASPAILFRSSIVFISVSNTGPEIPF